MRLKKLTHFVVITIVGVALSACGDEGSSDSATLFEVVHDEATSQLQVIVHPQLAAGQSLHVRVRQGPVGVLECEQMVAELAQIDGSPVDGPGDGDRFEGPEVPQSVFDMQNPYDSSWLEYDEDTGLPLRGHTDIAAIESTFYTIDICLMMDGEVVRGAEMDILRALDVAGTGKFDGYGDANERIVSVTRPTRRPASVQMGEIPFFPADLGGRLRDLQLPGRDPDPDDRDPDKPRVLRMATPTALGADRAMHRSDLCRLPGEELVDRSTEWRARCATTRSTFTAPASPTRWTWPNQRPARDQPAPTIRAPSGSCSAVRPSRRRAEYNDVAMLGTQPVHGRHLLLPERALFPDRRPPRARTRLTRSTRLSRRSSPPRCGRASRAASATASSA